MTIKQNWDLNFTIRASADDESALVGLLLEVANRIAKGATNGEGNLCVGTYEFYEGPEDFAIIPSDDELRNIYQEAANCNPPDDVTAQAARDEMTRRGIQPF